jgi:hypothetical protein
MISADRMRLCSVLMMPKWRAVRCAVRNAASLWLLVILQGCAVVGPASVNNGRSAYNTVINATEDEQILSMIIRQRYDETFGMLAVSSVTASLRIGATIGANAGIGPSSSFEGNLVPLSAGAMYEENPTISYVPMRGEQFLERMLAPVSAEQALLLSRMSTDEVEVLRLLVRRANGIVNPIFSSRPSAVDGESRIVFDRFIELYARLREQGRLDIVRSADQQYQMLLHDFTEDESREVGEFLQALGLQKDLEGRGPIVLRLRFFVGEPRTDAVDLETPSALEIIEAVGFGVDVPDVHLDDGVARPSALAGSPAIITIHSSCDRPSHASVAVMHRGWWFFVDERDARSKQAFIILRTLIGLRLDEGTSGQATPVLTVPVAR